MDQKVTVGRIVHFVLPAGRYKGEHRAAIVTSGFSGPNANLTVFLDQTDDFAGLEILSPFLARAWSAPFDAAGKVPGSWHWPERD